LKRCSCFDLTGESGNAKEACMKIIDRRKQQYEDCVIDLRKNLEAAFTHRRNICKFDKNWQGEMETSGQEVADMLEKFVVRVSEEKGVIGFTDKEVNAKLAEIVELAFVDSEANPERLHSPFLLCQFDDKNLTCDDEKLGVSMKVRGAALRNLEKKADFNRDFWVYRQKYALREHSHVVNQLVKEMAGRMRSLRFFQQVQHLSDPNGCIECDAFENPRGGRVVSTVKSVAAKDAGVLSCCGHKSSLSVLKACAAREECVDGSCTVAVSSNDIVPASSLVSDGKDGGKWGAKLTAVVKKVGELVKQDDRVIVFVQFKDLKEKVSEALTIEGVKNVMVQGSFAQQIKALDFMQKDVLAKSDPRVLLLTMDDESSSGVNLTNANHAVFVHPLLASGMQQYKAYETQAIGRIQRYGQKKTCHVWRYLCEGTIDEEIFSQYGEQ